MTACVFQELFVLFLELDVVWAPLCPLCAVHAGVRPWMLTSALWASVFLSESGNDDASPWLSDSSEMILLRAWPTDGQEACLRLLTSFLPFLRCGLFFLSSLSLSPSSLYTTDWAPLPVSKRRGRFVTAPGEGTWGAWCRSCPSRNALSWPDHDLDQGCAPNSDILTWFVTLQGEKASWVTSAF